MYDFCFSEKSSVKLGPGQIQPRGYRLVPGKLTLFRKLPNANQTISKSHVKVFLHNFESATYLRTRAYIQGRKQNSVRKLIAYSSITLERSVWFWQKCSTFDGGNRKENSTHLPSFRVCSYSLLNSTLLFIPRRLHRTQNRTHLDQGTTRSWSNLRQGHSSLWTTTR